MGILQGLGVTLVRMALSLHVTIGFEEFGTVDSSVCSLLWTASLKWQSRSMGEMAQPVACIAESSYTPHLFSEAKCYFEQGTEWVF